MVVPLDLLVPNPHLSLYNQSGIEGALKDIGVPRFPTIYYVLLPTLVSYGNGKPQSTSPEITRTSGWGTAQFKVYIDLSQD